MRSFAWMLVSSLVALGGCSSDTGGSGPAAGSGGSSSGSGGGSATGGAPGSGGSVEGSGGGSDTGGSTGTGGSNETGGSTDETDSGAAGAGGVIPLPDAAPADETLCGDVTLSATKTVDSGKTVAICAGATIKAAANVSLTVRGTLLIQGTMAGPVKFAGVAAGSSAWAGLVLENGGSIVATWTEIRGANLAVSAKVGSKYSFDHLVVENSQAMFVLASTGTVSHATWTGLGPSQNVKPVLIHSASPKFTDSAFDNGEKGSPDIVNVDGATSAASFDHLEVTGTHCAFHFDFGSGCSITNSYIHDNSYALMIQSSTNTKIEHNSFEGNSVNLGDCSGGSVVATGNYFQGPVFNKSCGSQTSTDNKPAPLTDVGPRL